MSEELPKILYVDDEGINLVFFAMNFRKDFQVITTASPLDALKIIEENKEIKLIVTDYKMPSMSGLDLIRQVKKEHPERVCILLTGFMIDEILTDNDSRELVHSYFLKPWNKEDLKETFLSILSGDARAH
ncbi:MAG: response regulator [Bacteroidales bacterium]